MTSRSPWVAVDSTTIPATRARELRDAWEEANARGPAWRKALAAGRARLDPNAATLLKEALGDPPTG